MRKGVFYQLEMLAILLKNSDCGFWGMRLRLSWKAMFVQLTLVEQMLKVKK